jgi:hypothetical protein
MYGDDVDCAIDALNGLALTVTELAETVPGDSEVSRFARKISPTADAIAAAQAAEARRLDEAADAAVADPAVRAATERFAAERTRAAFDDLADLIEPILGIDRAATIIPCLPETDPRYWTWKHFEPHGTPRAETSHEPGR